MHNSKGSKGIVKGLSLLAVGTAMATLSLSASAGGPPKGAGEGSKPEGIACQQAGIGTLRTLGLLSAVAKNGIEVVGLGMVDFQTVLSLHRTNPEYFDGGDDAVTVIVPGMGEVTAFWCGEA
ncbi:MAG: hypothetical protein PVH89_10040 [Gammaproteobacteria bacterium]